MIIANIVPEPCVLQLPCNGSRDQRWRRDTERYRIPSDSRERLCDGAWHQVLSDSAESYRVLHDPRTQLLHVLALLQREDGQGWNSQLTTFCVSSGPSLTPALEFVSRRVLEQRSALAICLTDTPGVVLIAIENVIGVVDTRPDSTSPPRAVLSKLERGVIVDFSVDADGRLLIASIVVDAERPGAEFPESLGEVHLLAEPGTSPGLLTTLTSGLQGDPERLSGITARTGGFSTSLMSSLEGAVIDTWTIQTDGRLARDTAFSSPSSSAPQCLHSLVDGTTIAPLGSPRCPTIEASLEIFGEGTRGQSVRDAVALLSGGGSGITYASDAAIVCVDGQCYYVLCWAKRRESAQSTDPELPEQPPRVEVLSNVVVVPWSGAEQRLEYFRLDSD